MTTSSDELPGRFARAFLARVSRGRLPRTSGTLAVAGLRGPVEILRDRWGVPHVYGGNNRDVLFAQGYVHAQDRLWQMDFTRRLVAGRLSEVVGAQALPADRWLRILGLRRVAEQEVGLLDPETLGGLEAYAAGVNAFIARGPLPVEFTLLRYRPGRWRVADTLGWIKLMSWSLSVNWETEMLRARLIARLGPERAAELEPPYCADWPQIVPPGVNYRHIGRAALDRAQAARPPAPPPPQAGLGSNNWVLAGARTATGMPLLANDMHLSLDLPAIWYENHLCGGDWHVTGVTFPGIPGVVAGHNGRVAWGYTNGFADVQDLYLEHLRRADDGRVQYEFRGEWHDAEVVRERIRVRGSEPETLEVVITRHGPVINAPGPGARGEQPLAFAGEEPLAMRWTSLEPDTMARAVPALARAHNCLEFREALRHWTAPIQNVVYADVEGNIGYSLPGKLPIRAQGDGLVPVPGWTGEYEWLGYVPYDELPHLYNPPQGYVVTANNRVAGDEYPYFISREYVLGDRAQRIVELVGAREKIDLAYIRRMHFDQVSPSARVVAPYLGQVQTDDPELAAVVELLRGWDGTLAADSVPATVYEAFMSRFIVKLLAPALGDDLAGRYAGRGPLPGIAEGSMFSQRAWEWVRHILAEPDSHWYDLGHPHNGTGAGGERRDGVLRLVLREVVDYLKAKLGPRPEDWTYGRFHRLTYAHALGGVPALGAFFNRGPYPVGGDGNTVWATGPAGPPDTTEKLIGPPFRFIADLGDLRNSLGLLAPGQSGNPASPHYDDGVRAWLEGGYHPMLWAREDVEAEEEARLTLKPEA